MEFWGAEVKKGEPLKVSPGDGMVLHLSRANLGELKKVKGNESVCLFVNFGGKKRVLGTLLTDKLPQQQYDLVFNNDFELSHNWKHGSVYFYGYKAHYSCDEDDSSDGEFDESESEEDIPLNIAKTGKHEPKVKKDQKSAEAAKEKKSDAGKQKMLPSEIKSSSTDEDSMSEDDDDDDDDDDSENEDGSDDSDDEADESKQETPKKAETSKRRPVESASKTPVPNKKAKVTPQRTDGKKGGHVDTPYPSKRKSAGKTPANKKTPK